MRRIGRCGPLLAELLRGAGSGSFVGQPRLACPTLLSLPLVIRSMALPWRADGAARMGKPLRKRLRLASPADTVGGGARPAVVPNRTKALPFSHHRWRERPILGKFYRAVNNIYQLIRVLINQDL